ncbi:MAG: DUF5107 domain-containing protein [Anaerolineae bacterium]|nr:DUF5107 domain-containing protein [Anaerolineae bacterium]
MTSHRQHLAARGVLLLAAFLITACGSAAAPAPKTVPATPTPPAMTHVTPTAVPPTASPVSSPTPVEPEPTVSQPTPPPATPVPVASPTLTASPTSTSPNLMSSPPASSPQVSLTTVTLPTYPLWDFLTEQTDPVYKMPVFYFDRAAFEAANPAPAPKDYTGVVLENTYLRLTFLPELGGRLYSAVVKATGQEIFYHNPVVKPSRYGVLQPYEANWWLATGGMEWAYPTQEHGYRFGVPWFYSTSVNSEGASITLSDTAEGRVGAEVTVTLPPDSAAFTVAPRLVNKTGQAVPVQFWTNAALTLGAASMSPQTQFIVPTDKIIVHSRGEAGWTVPGERQESSWPLAGQTDLRQYSQWANYLGFFVPNMAAPFIGAYNPETNVGVARLIRPGEVPGNKLFAFSTTFPDKSYTDDGSQYFELWGGANRGFWPKDDVTVPPGGPIEWRERWWPLAGLGGLTWANEHAAIHLHQTSLSLLVSRPLGGTITVLAGETTVLTQPFTADPATPLRWEFAAPAQPVQVQVADESGTILLDYQP